MFKLASQFLAVAPMSVSNYEPDTPFQTRNLLSSIHNELCAIHSELFCVMDVVSSVDHQGTLPHLIIC